MLRSDFVQTFALVQDDARTDPTDQEPIVPEPPPPWIAFPSLAVDDPPTQGAEEAYIDLDWLPFWTALGVQGRADYLDRWNASSVWRDAIRERYDPPAFEAEDDAQDSAAWRRAHAGADWPGQARRPRRGVGSWP